ncbi:MAG: hypothetical protein ACR2F2_08955 [Pyrinomonadaceae bacterium]
MKPKEISKLIEKEINGDWSISNWHNCDLKKCLIRPKRRKIRFGAEIKEVWIVLEEKPEIFEGFRVFFDDETKIFGLVQHSEPYGYACNSHDTFLAAFKSM